METPEGLDPVLWAECEALGDAPRLYRFAMNQRRIAAWADLARASRFYERGKRDGAKAS